MRVRPLPEDPERRPGQGAKVHRRPPEHRADGPVPRPKKVPGARALRLRRRQGRVPPPVSSDLHRRAPLPRHHVRGAELPQGHPVLRGEHVWPGIVPPRQRQEDADMLDAKRGHRFHRRLELHFFFFTRTILAPGASTRWLFIPNCRNPISFYAVAFACAKPTVVKSQSSKRRSFFYAIGKKIKFIKRRSTTLNVNHNQTPISF